MVGEMIAQVVVVLEGWKGAVPLRVAVWLCCSCLSAVSGPAVALFSRRIFRVEACFGWRKLEEKKNYPREPRTDCGRILHHVFRAFGTSVLAGAILGHVHGCEQRQNWGSLTAMWNDRR